MRFTFSTQIGAMLAQVFSPDGKSVAIFDATDPPEVANARAASMALLLNGGVPKQAQPEAVQVPLCARTAPERIWLQTDINEMRADDPFENDGVTWCAESVGGTEVEYIRADLAAAPPQPPGPGRSAGGGG